MVGRYRCDISPQSRSKMKSPAFFLVWSGHSCPLPLILISPGAPGGAPLLALFEKGPRRTSHRVSRSSFARAGRRHFQPEPPPLKW
jgi:hypothetical protein